MNINSGDNYEPVQDSYTGNTTYPTGRKRTGKGFLFGCGGILAIIIFVIALVIAWFAGLDSLFRPDALKGDFMDMSYIPNSGYLWIVTDGSFSYIQETKSPGRYSMGRKGLWCKTWNYLYDPVKEKIIMKFKVPFDELPPPMKVFYARNGIWVVTNYANDALVQINQYNCETGEEIMNTEKFISNNPELSTGVSQISYNAKPLSLKIKTKDGIEYLYDIEKDKFYDGWAEFNKRIGKDSTRVTVFALGRDKSGGNERLKLYRYTAPKFNIKEDNDFNTSNLDDQNSIKFFSDASSKRIMTNKIFLDALMLDQNEKYCLIIHQTQIGKKADRMLTLVSDNGSEVWTIPQNELFKKTAVDEDDPFSSTFFMKSKFKGSIEKDILIFSLQGVGAMGFEINSGKKLWVVEF